jgi:cAMP phosphodiesterase
MLVDGRLAIDAGGLTSSLTFGEQEAIEAVLITHRHFDHIKDLPMLAHSVWESKSLHVYCTQETYDALHRHVFNGVLWPDVEQESEGFYPVKFHVVRAGEWFDVLGYRVYAQEMPHSVPTVGYCVEAGGKRFFYTADTRGSGDPPWAHLRPDVLLIECTMSSEVDEEAARYFHMTPVSLGRELRAFEEKEGYIPQTVCVHINARHEAPIREQLRELSERLGAEVTPGHEGMLIEL